jgi:hypothetical protein
MSIPSSGLDGVRREEPIHAAAATTVIQGSARFIMPPPSS